MKLGIQSRLLVLEILVLVLGLSAAGWVLDRSFQASVRASAEEQLRLLVFSLMGSVEDIDGTLSIGGDIPEPRLSQPESGLYAAVFDDVGQRFWRSLSSVGEEGALFAPRVRLNPGEFRFSRIDHQGLPHFMLSYAVIWESVEDVQLLFQVVADQAAYARSIASFRRSLWLGLSTVVALFVLAQFLAVRWGLRPLRTMAEEVAELESGRRENLSDDYPAELVGLARNLDRFVAHEQRSRTRYRKAMEDLAHSLKTPLAVLRNSLRDPRFEDVVDQHQLMNEQVDRMETAVTYQLGRASVTGPVIVGQRVAIDAMVERLLRALGTAYQDRGLSASSEVPAGFTLRGDERDLLEVIGNLLENAFKYTRSRILVRAELEPRRVLIVEDDGPGIDPEAWAKVLSRGNRADEVQPGQGIGLSVVAELVSLYQGELSVGRSRWGGAAIRVAFNQ